MDTFKTWWGIILAMIILSLSRVVATWIRKKIGCAGSLSQIHNSAPRLSLISSKSPEQLGNCVLHEAKNYKSILWLVPQMTLVNREGVYYLVMEANPGKPWAEPWGEVSFIPTPDGGSKVEYRVSGVRYSNRVCKFILDYVEKCK